MANALRLKLSNFAQKANFFLNIISGIDDPQGEYVAKLEQRLQVLDAEVDQLKVRVIALERTP